MYTLTILYTYAIHTHIHLPGSSGTRMTAPSVGSMAEVFLLAMLVYTYIDVYINVNIYIYIYIYISAYLDPPAQE